MSHTNFLVSSASSDALSLAVIGGATGALVLISLVIFLIWRDKRRGTGKPRPAQRLRGRKAGTRR
jgi:hypothetical protein